jgi:opacity protein-like surface antigen
VKLSSPRPPRCGGGGGLYGGGSPFSPYIGVGGGGARMALEDITLDLVTNWIDDVDYVLAYQFIGEVAFEISDRAALTFDYRYIRTENIGMTDEFGTSAEFDSNQSTFMIGLRSNF